MASAAVYDAITSFLETDIITTVNAEQTGIMVTGSVTTARKSRNASPRRVHAYPLSVEIVPLERRAEAIGIGVEDVTYVFDLCVSLRRKALPQGKTQLDIVEDVARAIVRRYQGISNLAITVTGATLARSACAIQAFEDGDEAELERAIVRLAITFTEPLATNN